MRRIIKSDMSFRPQGEIFSFQIVLLERFLAEFILSEAKDLNDNKVIRYGFPPLRLCVSALKLFNGLS